MSYLGIRLSGETVDVTYPDGKSLVVKGPLPGSYGRTLWFGTPDGSQVQTHPQPLAGQRLVVNLAGMTLVMRGTVGRSPCNCHMTFDMPTDVRIQRRGKPGSRRAS